MTYTFVELAVPAELYDFVTQKMIEADYRYVFEVGMRPEVGKDCGRIDMHGLALTRLPSSDTAEEKGFRAGVEAMRQLAGYVAIHACLSPPDGGSPTDDEREMCAEVARQIYASGMPLRPTKVLDAIADKVLAYHPKPKSEAAKSRKRKASKIARKSK